MNTPCKILAMAWMAIRPFSTNVHADNINWEEVLHFFNFDTITEREKQANLKTNIQLLVEEQLKLPSGKNLWKAFQFWENQHPELGFQFEFTLTSNTSAGITLKNLKYLKCLTQNKEMFCFEVTINEVFAENLEEDQIFSENMLYRPCLVRLIDPNNPSDWQYHLREQELPFFITLAHEFLHALNQLERIDKVFRWLKVKNMQELVDKLEKLKQEDLIFDIIFRFNNPQKLEISKTFNQKKQAKNRFQSDLKELIGDYKEYNELILDLLNKIMPIQSFLAIKLALSSNVSVLQKKYTKLWQNDTEDDSLDEMTVILGSQRRIGSLPSPFIGETTFLQEYYHDDSIIPWSHYPTHLIKFWQKMPILLEKFYVKKVFSWIGFGLKLSNISSILLEITPEKMFKHLYQTCYENKKHYKIIKKCLEFKVNNHLLSTPTVIQLINKTNNDKMFWCLFVPKVQNSTINLLPQFFIIKKTNDKYFSFKEIFKQNLSENINLENYY